MFFQVLEKRIFFFKDFQGSVAIMILYAMATLEPTQQMMETAHQRNTKEMALVLQVLLTYFLACCSSRLLKMTSRQRGRMPWSCDEPVIV